VNEKSKVEYRQGLLVFLGLAVLTAIEFVVAIYLDKPAVLLIIISLIKAGLIVQFFMHIYRLWREESH
jgi:cytochrome c oxidase subunit IV